MSSPRSTNRLRHALREYFTFTQSELRGTIALVVVIVLLVGMRWALPYMHRGKLNRLNAVEIDNPDSLIAVAAQQINHLDDSLKRNDNATENFNVADVEIEHIKFAFDPNTVAFPDLLRLGFDKRIANNIVRYRSKGGKFKSGNDMLKMYGVDSNLVTELQPYMVFPEAAVATKYDRPEFKETRYEPRPTNDYTSTYAAKAKRTIDINAADSATLVMANGIGPTYASRIIKLRNRLGAFVSKEQLKDVFGITPEAYETIVSNVTLGPAAPKKINLNTCTFDELRVHAYFNYKIAKAVIAYREAHNGFKSVDELKNVEQIDQAFYDKIQPYVSVE